MNNLYSNFNQSYMPNQTLIDKTNFKNTGNIIHNNLADNLLLERIVEYQINIDSNDRNINVYPNPFKFTIIFGGVSSQLIRSRDNLKNEYFESSPKPVIERNFKNVKFIRIDYLILPRFIKLKDINKEDKQSIFKKKDEKLKNMIKNNNIKENIIKIFDFDRTENNNFCLLSSYGYLILRINEMSTSRILGTNNLLSNNSFIIYADKQMGSDYVMWVTSVGSKIFHNSNLGNLEKLTISILTPDGKQLCFIDTNNKEIDCKLIYNDKSFDNIVNRLKCFISVIIGVVENELNTQTKFSN